jgi:MFS family permease
MQILEGPAKGRADVQRNTLRVLVVTQLLGGIGLAAGVAVGALLAGDLLGGQALTGLPAAAATAGGAGATLPISRLMARSGRRPGLAAGYAVGGAGAGLVAAAAQLRSFPLLLAGMLLFGVGNTASLLARYAAADLAAPHQRGRAVSTVLFATTFGAVAGPNLVEPAGTLAQMVSLPTLAGPFLLSVTAYTLAASLVSALLRPDPLLTARAGEPPTDGSTADASRGSSAWGWILRGPALAGLAGMVGAQFVMVAMMTMTPVHMREHAHGLGIIGFVIGAHVTGMFAFAPLGGLLVDRLGSPTTLRLGAIILLAAGLIGALVPASSVPGLTAALFLLGLGWNFSLVAGSTQLIASVPLTTRAGAQGNADLLVGLAGAAGGLGSGLVFALSGFAVLGLLTAVTAAALLTAARPSRATTSTP